jgi:hypothetical protein
MRVHYKSFSPPVRVVCSSDVLPHIFLQTSSLGRCTVRNKKNILYSTDALAYFTDAEFLTILSPPPPHKLAITAKGFTVQFDPSETLKFS